MNEAASFTIVAKALLRMADDWLVTDQDALPAGRFEMSEKLHSLQAIYGSATTFDEDRIWTNPERFESP